MSYSFLNRVGFETSTTGTEPVSIGSALDGYCTPAEAGAEDGATYLWCAEDGTDFEIFEGEYSSSGPSISRGNVLLSKISGNAGTSQMSFSGTAVVRCVASGEAVRWAYSNLYGILEPPTEALLKVWQADGSATRPRPPRTGALDRLYGEILNVPGLIDKLDFLYVFGQHAERNALYDLINPDRALATVTGTPTWTADEGYSDGAEGDGVSLGFHRGELSQFGQDSAHIGAFVIHPVVGSGKILQAGSDCFLDVANDGDLVACINNAASTSFAVPSGLGHSVAVRTSSSNVNLYKNGVLLGSDTQTSAAPDTTDFLALGDDAPSGPDGPGYQPVSARFDGSNDYLARGGSVTGLANGKQGTFSAWIRLQGGDGNTRRIVRVGSNNFAIFVTTANRIRAQGQNSGNSNVFFITSDHDDFVVSREWFHVLISWNLSLETAHLFIDGADDLQSGPTITDDTINYNTGAFAVGSDNEAGGNLLNADVADLWFHNAYIDLSNPANVEKFIKSGGPVYLGDNGELPLGTAPLVFLSGAVASWHTNKGSGGGFTENGELTAGSAAPEGPGEAGEPGSNEVFAVHGGGSLSASEVQALAIALHGFATDVGAI